MFKVDDDFMQPICQEWVYNPTFITILQYNPIQVQLRGFSVAVAVVSSLSRSSIVWRGLGAEVRHNPDDAQAARGVRLHLRGPTLEARRGATAPLKRLSPIVQGRGNLS